MNQHPISIHRKRNKSLGLLELVAIALGGMVGGGIFTVLGISVSMIGNLTPAAIVIGGIIALLAAYSYVKLGVYYKDEGAAFSFFKRTYTKSHFAPSVIGWFVIFGYISTLALYAYTFSSYVISVFPFAQDIWIRKAVAVGVIAIFTAINTWSVNGMGKIEDIMVYTKLGILLLISVLLIKFGSPNFSTFIKNLSADAGKHGFSECADRRLHHLCRIRGVPAGGQRRGGNAKPRKKYRPGDLPGDHAGHRHLCCDLHRRGDGHPGEGYHRE